MHALARVARMRAYPRLFAAHNAHPSLSRLAFAQSPCASSFAVLHAAQIPRDAGETSAGLLPGLDAHLPAQPLKIKDLAAMARS
ncbi:hypothetical protein NQ024_11530, partial [Corynebacterium sp. 35RC1]|nr:hypothetical protein [Corynebacterium sp. 35RC1]